MSAVRASEFGAHLTEPLADDPLFEAVLGARADFVQVPDRDVVRASDLFGAEVEVGEVAAHVRSNPAQHDVGGDNATVTAGASGRQQQPANEFDTGAAR
ncbi:hypothetical protein OHA42_13565 [Nocardia sp. NBC_01009]|nr:hypothetical protein OHA42_13565 [Nocardia sp. NBC_01009]